MKNRKTVGKVSSFKIIVPSGLHTLQCYEHSVTCVCVCAGLTDMFPMEDCLINKQRQQTALCGKMPDKQRRQTALCGKMFHLLVVLTATFSLVRRHDDHHRLQSNSVPSDIRGRDRRRGTGEGGWGGQGDELFSSDPLEILFSLSPGGNLTYRAPPPQYSARLVLKCSLECAEHVTTCSQRIFWDAPELQPFNVRVPSFAPTVMRLKNTWFKSPKNQCYWT